MQKDLATLANELFAAKQAEKSAKAERIQAEKAIGLLVETAEKGSKTVDAGNGIRITVTRGITFKADMDAIRSLTIPEEVMPITMVPASYKFDPKKYESVRENHPDIAAKLANCVTATPKKLAVTMKVG